MAESLQNIKRRVGGISNIGKITKAMELVAATKMRRSQEIALGSRPYAYGALELLGKLSALPDVKLPAILLARKVERTALVLITSDKGLAGSFNSSVIRKFENYMRGNKIDTERNRYAFIAVGQKAGRHLERRVPALEHSFTRIGDYTTLTETKPISDHLTRGFLDRKWDKVIVFSTHFRSALKQEVLVRKIFPVDLETIQETIKELIPEHGHFAELRENSNSKHPTSSLPRIDYLLEPSPELLLSELAAHLIEMQTYHLILEANASEHAARRFAMKSASDNAAELEKTLTLIYNKARQAAITKELVEISSGAEALG